MHVPICKHETLETGLYDEFGRYQYEAIAFPVECGHAHRYLDVERQLRLFNSDLRLGFDRRPGSPTAGLWLVLREDRCPQLIPVDDGTHIVYLRPTFSVLYPLAWRIELRNKNGYVGQRLVYRDPGEWIFGPLHMGGWKEDQFGFNPSKSFNAGLSNQVKEREARFKAKVDKGLKEVEESIEPYFNDDGSKKLQVAVRRP